VDNSNVKLNVMKARTTKVVLALSKELSMTLALLFGVSVLVYTLLYFSPGDPFSSFSSGETLGTDAAESTGEKSVWVTHYLHWLSSIITGDFGTSIRSGEPVLPAVLQVTLNTLNLMFFAILITLAIALPIGIINALRNASVFSSASTLVAYVMSSLPVFWLGYIAVYISTKYFEYFPLSSSFSDSGGIDWLKFFFPVVVLGLGSGLISEIIRFVRMEVARVMDEEYIRTARAKGASVWLHAYKEALVLPVSEIVASKIPFFLGGAIIVEQIFNWQGVGRMAWQAAQDRDFPVILCITLVAALIVRGGSLLQRVIYILINPRASQENK